MKSVIQGNLVCLHEWDKTTLSENFPFLLKWFTDPEIMCYVGFFEKTIGFKSIQEISNFISLLPDAKYFGMYVPKSKLLIGVIELSKFQNQSCEFGIFIGEKKCWGKGFGTEATSLICQHAFLELEISKIHLTVAGKNIIGQKCYKKAGFRVIDNLTNERKIFIDGKFLSDNTIKMELTSNERIYE